MTLHLAFYNMHGWNNGDLYLQLLCDNNDIIFITEHWLLPQNLDTLLNYNAEFSAYAVSGITDIETCKNRRSTLWRIKSVMVYGLNICVWR